MIPRYNDGRDWFFEKRFGLFLHWGLYAVPAWHEQLQWRKNVPRKEYEKLVKEFNPVKYDPEKWLDIAQEAGMEYICFTTKHHDGFCMWNTAYTDYNIMKTPYGKDVLAMLADACHKRKMPLCLYYSVADWHHPNYPNQNRTHEIDFQPEDSPHMEKYMEFLKAQIRELCTNYGEIHGIWWDMNVPGHRDPSVHKMIHELQPKAVINNRGFETGIMGQIENGDFTTPERHLPDGRAFTVPTEACQSLGAMSWGYKKDEDFFSDRHIMRSIDKIMSMGGNYLLNIGPKADGTIQPEFKKTLKNIGSWYNSVKESYKAEPSSCMTENNNVFITKKDDIIYVHLNPDSDINAISLAPLDVMPEKATLMNDGRELECVVDSGTAVYYHAKNTLRIRKIPVNEFSNQIMVIKLDFKPGTFK